MHQAIGEMTARHPMAIGPLPKYKKTFSGLKDPLMKRSSSDRNQKPETRNQKPRT
jgi:hypothetical protein